MREAVEASPYGFAVVLSDAGVLLGRLRNTALQADRDTTVEASVKTGPPPPREN